MSWAQKKNSEKCIKKAKLISTPLGFLGIFLVQAAIMKVKKNIKP